MNLVATISIIPCHIRDIKATTILVTTALLAATGRIFPFCLCRQAELSTCQAVQFANKLQTIIPANLLYRQVVTLEIGRISSHHCLPQRLGHLVFTYIVIICQDNLTNRFLVIPRILHLRSSTHHKGTSLDFHHINSDAVLHRDRNLITAR